jgi:hypothetical protein
MFTLIRGAIVALALTLAACGGGSGESASSGAAVTPSGCNATDCGTAYIGLMDADGDFTSYTVDVVSLTLKKANGSTVDALPVSSRVDFAELVDLKEFVTAATIPNGAYVEGTIRLDYSNAEILVDVGGMPTPAVVVDANGQPLTTVDLEIRLDNRNHLVISPGRPALLELDFDLLASNTVDLTQNPIRVSVQPFIVASVDRADSREARVRGPLISVDTAGSSYRIDLRPFRHATARLGELTVNTTASTEFEVDGTTYTGAAGLTAMAALPAGSRTAAFGTLNTNQRRFTAERVHAGTSVEGPQFDVVHGSVIARNGDELTVRGATLVRRNGSVVVARADTTLIVGANTKVTKDGQRNNDLGAGALSVGQRIDAFGTATEANGVVTLNATSGRVRMHMTHLLGTVTSAQPGLLTLDLSAIDRHRPAVYDFSGTGTAPAQDADPASYEIATGNLNLSQMEVGKAARAFGFVAPFGEAPPDFEGRTVVDFREVQALLVMGYGLSGASAPFLSLDASGIVIDNDNAAIGARHYIAIGPVLLDVTQLASSPRIVPDAGRPGLFAIGEPRRVESFSDFGEFTAKIAERLNAGAKVTGLTASGSFDAASGDLTAHRVLVNFKPAP